MALPSPTNVWKLTKFLLRSAEFAVPAGLAYLGGLTSANEAAADPHWVRCLFTFSRTTPAGTSEDLAQFKLDLLNITGGTVDSSWTSGDFTAVEAAFATFWTAMRPEVASNVTHKQRRYYAMSFNASDPGPGARTAGNGAFNDSGPPVHVVDINTAGTGSDLLPYQMATSATFKTAWPRHWGRAYVPCPAHAATSVIDIYGRLIAAHRTVVADAFHDLFATLADADFLAVVPVTQLDKAAFHALLGIESVVVDDIPDVQRSRRPKQVLARTIGA